ncbi:MAG: hypothetical protein WDN49_13870 [Acetobacteraceae bacterium]
MLAGDATHYWANIRKRSPFPLVVDIGRMAEGWRTCEELADGPDHIIPAMTRRCAPASRPCPASPRWCAWTCRLWPPPEPWDEPGLEKPNLEKR